MVKEKGKWGIAIMHNAQLPSLPASKLKNGIQID
jgi:hypothetical protein